MKKIYLSILLVLAVVALGVVAYASVAVKVNGVQVGAAEAINLQTSGVNWTQDGFNLNISGVNWSNIAGASLSLVNWTNTYIPNQGVNWASLHVLAITYGDHSGINWQAIPGS